MTLLWRLYVTWTKHRKCRKSAGNCRKSVGNCRDIFCPRPLPAVPFDFHRCFANSKITLLGNWIAITHKETTELIPKQLRFGNSQRKTPWVDSACADYHCGRKRCIINSETFSTCSQHVNFTSLNSQEFHACISYMPAHMLGNDTHVRAMKNKFKLFSTCS